METAVTDWLRSLSGDLADGRSGGALNFARGAYNGVFLSVTSRRPLGTNVYETDWDLLIVLDACRVDALREVAPEYEFLDDVGSIWSVGSASHEWLCKTFTRAYADEIAETAYISTNPNTPGTFQDGERPPRTYVAPVMAPDWDVVEESDFGHLRQIHNHDYEGYFETVPPDLVTDHAIQAGRTTDLDRMIVHYFQPHRPYIGSAYPEERPVTPVEDQPWEQLREGNAAWEEVWELYLENLRLVLDSVERLLENVDADRVAITADHGELMGEMGLYGHPEGLIHPKLKKVPWAITTATDEGSSSPTVDVDRQHSTSEVEDRLRHLGYI